MLCAAATKRGKWSVPEQPQSHSNELSTATFATRSAPAQHSLGRSSLSKGSMWPQPAGQGRAQPAPASANNLRLSEGIFSQPSLQQTTPYLQSRVTKQPELWGSSDSGSPSTDPKDMAAEIRKQQEYSIRHLLQQQGL